MVKFASRKIVTAAHSVVFSETFEAPMLSNRIRICQKLVLKHSRRSSPFPDWAENLSRRRKKSVLPLVKFSAHETVTAAHSELSPVTYEKPLVRTALRP